MDDKDDLIQNIMNMLGEHPEEKLAPLLGALGMAGKEEHHEEAAPSDSLSLLNGLGGGMDIGMLLKLKGAMERMNGEEDDRTRLLTALQPFLSEKRQPVYHQALRMMQMSKFAALAKELDLFKELKLP